MTDGYHFLAMDLGAESGRGEIVTLSGGKVTMEEVHRFPNRPVRLGKTLHWDFPFLFGEILASLRACAHRGVKLSGIGVDTWGVDFGLLGADGALLGNPVHYRDSRTENIHEYSNRFLSRDEIYALTAYEPWAISSLFQLLSMQRDGSPLLGIAAGFLNTPDLFNYFLTGVKASDRSIANTSNLMGTDGQWCKPVIDAFRLPAGMFSPLVEPGTVLGPLSAGVQKETGLGAVPVITTCGHDTSAAVAAVPAEGDHWAFISCGTWSILGSRIPQPIPDKRCWDLGFTNEYTIGGWYLGCNISGLWLVQQLRKKWDTPKDPWDYVRMTKEAGAQPASGLGLVNVAAPALLAPHDMEEELLRLVTGGPKPEGRGQFVRIVLESLALEYRKRLDNLAEVAGWKPKSVYLVGGGIANKLLCQLTANACGCPVYAGADQCTALGNALIQATALGILKGPEDIRQVMRASTETTVYEPKDQDLWARKRAQYAQAAK
jgi:rhamnulokinase